MSQFTNRNSAQRERDRRTIAKTGAGCWICGKPIDYTLKSPDPMSYEVDHVVPLSSAKTDEEPIGRAQLGTPVTNAHFVCRLAIETKKHNNNHNYTSTNN